MSLDDALEQHWQPVRRSVAVHARVLVDPQVLHTAPVSRFHPRVPDMKWVYLALQGLETGRQLGEQ